MANYIKKLPKKFVELYKEKRVPWGPVGYVVYKRTYSRVKPDGNTEEWFETVERCVNGVLRLGGKFTEEEACRLYDHVFNLRMSFSGRSLWQLGTDNMFRIGSDSLQNCWAVSVNDPVEPFCFTFNQLMLGGGVGYNITPEEVYSLPKVQYSPQIKHVDTFDCSFVVPDNREGWVKLLRTILESYFYKGTDVTYCTKGVRSKGTPIKTFGGTASGDQDLIHGLDNICKILSGAHGRKLTPTECLDIMNIIGSVVVAGNVRRSAQIALGSPNDKDYMKAKNWVSGKIPLWRSLSNNSVSTNNCDDLPEEFWSGYNGDGEPYGFVNLDLCRSHGRLIDGLNYRPDPDVIGTNPCVTGDMWVMTDQGPRQVTDLVGEDFKVLVKGKQYQISSDGFVKTGTKQVYRVETKRGFFVRATANHLLETQDGWKEVQELTTNDSLVLDNSYSEWGDPDSVQEDYETGWLVGNWLGDGTTIDTTILKYWEDAPCSLEKQSSSFCKGFLQGWFDADGTVTGDLQKGTSIRLTSVRLRNLEMAQRMLARLGVNSTIYKFRRKEGHRPLPGGVYSCQATHDLCISRDSMKTFMDVVGFTHVEESRKFQSLEDMRVRDYYEDKWVSQIQSITPDGVEDVYDVTVPEIECFNANGIITHNCAEITLCHKEPCNLMEQFVCRINKLSVFKDVAYLSYKVAKTISNWPFSDPETQAIVQQNHRLGIGVTGVQQATWWGPKEYDSVYRHIEQADEAYSKLVGLKQSIKLTTVKPSGTLSLLPSFKGGVLTPGVNDGYNEFHNRRIRFSADDPLVAVAAKNGYHVEPKREFDGSLNHSTMIVTFPVKQVGGKSNTAVHQLKRHRLMQTYWSDNAVSTTVYYRREELPEIKEYLRKYLKESIKSVSFLLHSEHGFDQAPLEAITEDEYNRSSQSVRRISSSQWVDSDEISLAEGVECAGGHCPVR